MMEFDYPAEANLLLGRAITLDNEIKAKKKELDTVKARLQALAVSEIENKNLRYIRFDSAAGSCEVSYKTKIELDDYNRIKNVFERMESTVAEDKITRTMEAKYSIESRFKAALIAFKTHDYAAHDIEEVMESLGIKDAKIRTLVAKKLKGDFVKDKQLLESVGCTGVMEEELDAIREQKNLENIQRFIDLNALTEQEADDIRCSVYVEDSLSLTLTGRE
ncbi:hypothetical protein [Pectinatus frisingensis]|uniref:hypothetical protein n=1 Tax=Pectinatus frisingensis TaxID=865 RepID=UPI003D802C5B